MICSRQFYQMLFTWINFHITTSEIFFCLISINNDLLFNNYTPHVAMLCRHIFIFVYQKAIQTCSEDNTTDNVSCNMQPTVWCVNVVKSIAWPISYFSSFWSTLETTIWQVSLGYPLLGDILNNNLFMICNKLR